MSKSFYSLAEIASRWGCSHSTVLTLVRSGNLQAVDISSNPGGRSRFIVPAESLEDFELLRTVTPPSTPVKRHVKVRKRDVIEFI